MNINTRFSEWHQRQRISS